MQRQDEQISSEPSSSTRNGRKFAHAQTTLKKSVFCRGKGLHTGKEIRLTLIPQPADSGILFQRVDLVGTHPFRLAPETLQDAQLATIIASPTEPDVRITTIEHLMAALHALAIDNILIQTDGPEIPIFDGSSQDFVFLLGCAGQKELSAPRRFIQILSPISIKEKNGAFVSLKPRKKRKLSFMLTIDYKDSLIGAQKIEFTLKQNDFIRDVAPCRTFVNKNDIENLKKQGLALGGSLRNAIVIDDHHILNPEGLRRNDEFIRHKLLDAIGDCYCFGYPVLGKFEGYKSGHGLNNRLIKTLAIQKEMWQFIS